MQKPRHWQELQCSPEPPILGGVGRIVMLVIGGAKPSLLLF
jgi:hypothetical protein